jgi:hypothetical protein
MLLFSEAVSLQGVIKIITYQICRQALSWGSRKTCLKVLSSEMDPAEIRLIRKVVIKERGAVVF